MRSQAMAIFFSVGLGVGGIIAPYFFGLLLEEKSRMYITIGYFLSI